MVEKWKYRIHLDKIVYVPEEGSIQRVLQDSIEIAQHEKKPVELHVNDIVMSVTSKSTLETSFKDYLAALDKRYQYMKNNVQKPLTDPTKRR